MHKLFTLEEIKIAAMDALAEMKMDDPDTVVDTLRGMQLLIFTLAEQMNDQEPEKEAEPAVEPVKKKAAPKKKPDPNGAVEIVQPGKFTGRASQMKFATWKKMMEMKTMDGKTAGDIAKMTNGEVAEDEVRAMCGGYKVAYPKWECLARALGTWEAAV